MEITLTEQELENVFENIKKWGFTNDGCACGEWGCNVREGINLYVYRSCRKANSTPDEKLWHLHPLTIYGELEYEYGTYTGGTYIENVEVEKELPHMTLNKGQEQTIVQELRKITLENYKYEFREAY